MREDGGTSSSIRWSRARRWCGIKQHNADIPFEQQPAPGFGGGSEEDAKGHVAPIGRSLRRLENKRESEEEAVEAKRRANNVRAEGRSHVGTLAQPRTEPRRVMT